MFANACSLWQQNQRDDAADAFRDLLKLDPDDHQFARYWLAASMLDLQRHDELQRLLEQYEEPTAVWRYAQALLAFRLGGDSDDARQLLQEAHRWTRVSRLLARRQLGPCGSAGLLRPRSARIDTQSGPAVSSRLAIHTRGRGVGPQGAAGPAGRAAGRHAVSARRTTRFAPPQRDVAGGAPLARPGRTGLPESRPCGLWGLPTSRNGSCCI